MSVLRGTFWLSVVVAFVALLHSPSYAADETGRFYSGGGPGEVVCTQFVSAMEAARRHKYQSLEYWQPIVPFVSYAAGFWTGFNYGWQGRQNIFDGLSIEDVLAKVETTCREHPTIKFYQALTFVVEARK
jgi:hypothetical protein